MQGCDAKNGGKKHPELQSFALGLERRRGVDCIRKMGKAMPGAGWRAGSWERYVAGVVREPAQKR